MIEAEFTLTVQNISVTMRVKGTLRMIEKTVLDVSDLMKRVRSDLDPIGISGLRAVQ